MSGTGKEFMEKTQYGYLGMSDQASGYPQPELELGTEDSDSIVDLPLPKDIEIEDIGLRQAIEKRSSVRNYSSEPLPIEELSYLLWCTQGVKEVVRDVVTFRNVPSAGARHALETYILVNNVHGLEKGLYRFLPIEHKLVEIDMSEDIADRVMRGCLDQPFVKSSAVTFIWTAVPYRMAWRYGQRGYRYLHLDAGHTCQNLYLSAGSVGCGVCAIAAFLDEEINPVIGVDGENEFVIYVATVGKK
ncbi:SagB/ThcOx family dehydrogenase [Methanolobus profundi]|uniref:SagB-type dehydrogenase domain-containing protein n=1 Tax=Methanolobus profundi TaxID=487685 RepID=A0A1I4T0M1_9EURY|nr:SagB/ThcOx family dehydrogenase [Methanolobus profundi]SFM70318.1 SagB-type dehydrogenase domain-containing protein [Methanolobus profundi]